MNQRKYNLNRTQYLAKKLLPQGRFRVLSCGCGMGEFATIMRDMGYNIVCLDRNKDFIRETRRMAFESYECDFEKEKLPFNDKSFDGITCLEVIEHVWDTAGFLEELKRIVKPEGWIIISTPNYSFWRFRLNHLFGKLYSSPNSSHKRFYSFKTIIRTIKSHGLDIEEWFVVCNFPKTKIKFTTRILPNFLGSHTLIKCRKI